MKKLIFMVPVMIGIMSGMIVLSSGIENAWAAVIDVGPEAVYQSIAEAVKEADDGDEIVVHGGIYDESVETFPIIIDKSVNIHACEGEEAVVSCHGLTAAVKLEAEGTVWSQINVSFIRSGIWLLADDITVTQCIFELSDTNWRETSCGLWSGGAYRMTLASNSFINCGVAIAGPPVTTETTGIPVLTAMFEVGEDQALFDSHKIENNYVNGKKLAYVIGLKDCIYSEECGQLIAVGCENVIFEGLDLSCASIGMELAYSDNITIRDCHADDCGVFGIYLCKSSDCNVNSISADRSAHGIDMRDVDRVIVSDCRTNGCGQGIFFSWGRDSMVENCTVKNNGTGIFSASGGHNSILNCVVEGNELGFYIKDEPVIITDCRISENTSAGIRVTGCQPQITGCGFTDNFVAALILSSKDGNISGNTWAGSVENSIYMKDSENIAMEDNTMDQEEADKIMILVNLN